MQTMPIEVYRKRLNEIPTKGRMHNRIIRFFPDTFLGNGHKGLAAVAKKHGIEVENLSWGEFVIFTNKSLTGLKLYSQGNLVAYIKMPGTSKIDMKTIQLIPRFFNGSTIDYQGSLEQVVRERLNK